MVPRGKALLASLALASFVVVWSTAPAAAPTTSLASVTTVNVNGVSRAKR